jgi:phosphoribosylformylglycinamidine synthase
VIADTEVASQRYADAQYDSTVQGNTVYGPQHGRFHPVTSGYWAGTPVGGSRAAAVVSTAFNPWLFDVHPVRALRQQFVALLAGQVLAGVEVGDICVCDNFYTPHLTEHWREWLVAMVDELALLVRHFGTPVISGKDSSAGSTHTDEGVVSVPPAVFLTALGKVPDAALLLGETWTGAGSALVRLGPATPSPAGTVASRVLDLGFDTGPGGLDDVPLDAAGAYLAALGAGRRLFRSGTLLGPGGLGARIVTGALASGLGVDIDPSIATLEDLFAEHRCAVLVEVDVADLAELPAELHPVVIGRLTGTGQVRLGDVDLMTPDVRESWTTAFSERLA